MHAWKNLPAPGACRHVVRLVESETNTGEPAALALAACGALWPVVQPLSITLEMAAGSRESPYLDLDISVPAPTWHLREVNAPPEVAVAARVRRSGHREETTAVFTLDQLEQLFTRAHAQSLENGYVPVLYGLELHYTRARVFQQITESEIVYGPEAYVIPVERRDDGLWVSGPLRNTMLNPPIKVTLENNDGRLTLSVCAGWSPWVEPGSKEAALFTACLQELERQGWTE